MQSFKTELDSRTGTKVEISKFVCFHDPEVVEVGFEHLSGLRRFAFSKEILTAGKINLGTIDNFC